MMNFKKTTDIDLGKYFGSDGNLDLLRATNPVPEFDNMVEFYEYLVVDDETRCKVDFPIDHDDGECDRSALPPGTHVAEHRYFVYGVPQTGSATGYIHQFFPKYDSEGNARRIAGGDKMLVALDYKYYRFARALCRRAWHFVRRGALAEDADQEFDQYLDCMQRAKQCLCENKKQCEVFEKLFREMVYRGIRAAWDYNSEQSLTLGRLMHRSIEMCYNQMYNPAEDRFHVPEMQQFARFHTKWVLPNKLRMFRTELSLAHKPDPNMDIYLCGQLDAIYIDPAGEMWLVDWKRSKEIKSVPFDKDSYGTGPCQGLADCNREHYNIQLNIYKYIVERNTSFRVAKCFIAVFHPNQDDYALYPVPDYQSRVHAALQQFVQHKKAMEQHAEESRHEKD